MLTLLLKRLYKLEATVGQIETMDGKTIVQTLERKNNANSKDDPNTPENESSCIPEGNYLCKWSRSNRFSNLAKQRLGKAYNEEKDSVWTYELIGVGNRAGIRIHSANWVYELHGCIAPASVVLDLDPKNEGKVKPDKRWCASQSRDAHKKLLALTKKEDFMLVITDYNKCSYDPKTQRSG